MTPDTIFAFFVFAFVAAVTPGPSNLLLLAAGAQVGFVRGLACLAGVIAGMALLIAAAKLGLGELVLGLPGAMPVLRWGGAAFLLWLAWKVASAPPMSPGRAAPGGGIGFWKVLAFQWTNPKSWIVSLSAAGTYGTEGSSTPLASALQLAVVFALAATPAGAAWLGFGTSLQRWLGSERRARAFNVALGALLAASVLLVVPPA